MKRILVADDKLHEVKPLIEELSKNYTVEYAPDGKKALDRINEGGIDGAVLDWEMIPPGMSTVEARPFFGNEVVQTVRKAQ